jgi:hypothetical protein
VILEVFSRALARRSFELEAVHSKQSTFCLTKRLRDKNAAGTVESN